MNKKAIKNSKIKKFMENQKKNILFYHQKK